MKYCYSCGLEQFQLCFHKNKKYLQRVDEIKVSPFILDQLIQVIDVEIQFYQMSLDLINLRERGLFISPGLSCLRGIYQQKLIVSGQVYLEI